MPSSSVQTSGRSDLNARRLLLLAGGTCGGADGAAPGVLHPAGRSGPVVTCAWPASCCTVDRSAPASSRSDERPPRVGGRRAPRRRAALDVAGSSARPGRRVHSAGALRTRAGQPGRRRAPAADARPPRARRARAGSRCRSPCPSRGAPVSEVEVSQHARTASASPARRRRGTQTTAAVQQTPGGGRRHARAARARGSSRPARGATRQAPAAERGEVRRRRRPPARASSRPGTPSAHHTAEDRWRCGGVSAATFARHRLGVRVPPAAPVPGEAARSGAVARERGQAPAASCPIARRKHPRRRAAPGRPGPRLRSAGRWIGGEEGRPALPLQRWVSQRIHRSREYTSLPDGQRSSGRSGVRPSKRPASRRPERLDARRWIVSNVARVRSPHWRTEGRVGRNTAAVSIATELAARKRRKVLLARRRPQRDARLGDVASEGARAPDLAAMWCDRLRTGYPTSSRGRRAGTHPRRQRRCPPRHREIQRGRR